MSPLMRELLECLQYGAASVDASPIFCMHEISKQIALLV